VNVDLIDGTYELFRHHYGLPSAVRERGSRSAATRGVLTSVVVMLEGGATHVGVATDHVIESFRNEMWAGYKSSLGMPEDLLAQFPLLAEALAAAGVSGWAMCWRSAWRRRSSSGTWRPCAPTRKLARSKPCGGAARRRRWVRSANG